MARIVAVAMSGGVDSSVAATLLAGAGDQVFGLMLRLWSDPDRGGNRCCAPEDVVRARQTAAILEIPFYVLDAQEPFREAVVETFVHGYAQGLTPNPCFTCNREIRWGFLLRQALAMGATHLATGHYAQADLRRGSWRLLRGRDPTKDQSYVLSVLGQHELAHALFPLGRMTKHEVRGLARDRDLPAKDRADSQDLCFLGGGDYRDFLADRVPDAHTPGPILNSQGESIGVHAGLSNYTVGQRKGIRLASSSALYVLEKRPQANVLVVGPRPALGRSEFPVGDLHWVAGRPPSSLRGLRVQVRYRSPAVPATIELLKPSQALVRTADPVAEVSPGQGAVFFRGSECLGGGMILP